ncbi:MAG: 5'/3'-nucleotidase SurE [Pelagibacteraceae bacterium]|nr:5'/3'-nucleotidase SurE [Pelagibacteraceae bacterium]|tara:strand:- start:3550 stop:4362 length:813 start_codon:yes stop_codon:yes gene_type:complete
MPGIDLKNSRILITNDDGFFSPGIHLLKSIVEKFSNDVWIVAPEFEKSGASHALSFMSDLNLKKQEEKVFSVNGTPGDCVAIGLDQVLKDRRPDIILSGVNSGCNIGEDTTYSGTIAGAMEGIIRKVPSISISQNYESGKKNQIKWDATNHFLPEILEKICKTGWTEDTFININFPYCEPSDVKGIEITTQGNRDSDDLIIYEKERDVFRFGLRRRVEEHGNKLGLTQNKRVSGFMTDVEAIANLYVSITPMHIDLTHESSLIRLKEAIN